MRVRVARVVGGISAVVCAGTVVAPRAALAAAPAPSAKAAPVPSAAPAPSSVPAPSSPPPVTSPSSSGAFGNPAPVPSGAAPAPTPPPEGTAPAAATDAPAEDEHDAEIEAREAAARRRERRRLVRLQQLREEEEREEHEERLAEQRLLERRARAVQRQEAASEHRAWRLVAPHFLVGVERVTNFLAWHQAQTIEVPSGTLSSNTSSIELTSSGTDLSFLSSGGSSPNPFGIPRLAFDGMLQNGLTVGGSLSYIVTSSQTDSLTTDGSTVGKIASDDPTRSVFVFAPRLGVMLPAGPLLGVWLRGGISRIVAKSERNATDTAPASTGTVGLWNFVVDPQLVINPLPHVGITLGLALDFPLSGSTEVSSSSATSSSSNSQDVTVSSYGVTSGLLAMF